MNIEISFTRKDILLLKDRSIINHSLKETRGYSIRYMGGFPIQFSIILKDNTFVNYILNDYLIINFMIEDGEKQYEFEYINTA
jgi:hypothetical protein